MVCRALHCQTAESETEWCLLSARQRQDHCPGRQLGGASPTQRRQRVHGMLWRDSLASSLDVAPTLLTLSRWPFLKWAFRSCCFFHPSGPFVPLACCPIAAQSCRLLVDRWRRNPAIEARPIHRAARQPPVRLVMWNHRASCQVSAGWPCFAAQSLLLHVSSGALSVYLCV